MVKKVKATPVVKEIEPKKKLAKVEKTKSVEVAKAKKLKEKLSKDKNVVQKKVKAKKVKKPKEDVKIQKSDVKDEGELVNAAVLTKAVEALKSGVEKTQGSGKEDLFSSEHRYGLQVVYTKVPKIPSHNRRILLKHSLFVDEEPSILFIFRDKSKKDHTNDEMVAEFKDFLNKHGVTNVKNVITLSELKKSYAPNNMKLKLLNSHDIFLVEPEIAEHTYSFLGKHFITKRKRPLQIDTKNTEKMTFSIDNAIMKVSFKLNSQSNFSVIEVGAHKMESKNIIENVQSTLEQLKEKWPGGWKNILRLYLKPMMPSKVSIPIYYSKHDPNDIEIPNVVGPKQMRRDRISKKLKNGTQRLRFDAKTKKIGKEKISSANINKQMKEKKNDKKMKKIAN